MNENEYAVNRSLSFEERENRRNSSKSNNTNKGRNEFLFRTVTAQFIASILVLAVLFIMRSSSPESFNYFKGKFKSLMKRDITVSEMVSAFRDFTSQNKAETEKETEKTEEKETVKQVKTEKEASGGEDLLKAQDKTTFSPVIISENLICPLEKYEITSKFGYRTNPISGEYGFHTGLDMAADEGTEIKAAYDGIVVETGYTDIRGNYIIIEHSETVLTGYYHCKEILCDIDQNVRKGQAVALVGSTGWSTGPHLHFEVKIDGVNCNPEYLINED
ncbi:MAG: M23 family metallopeptidase [Clostridiales bacterium]|nr:M23 family metallopeptidase [Clostridiales bacterium]